MLPQLYFADEETPSRGGVTCLTLRFQPISWASQSKDQLGSILMECQRTEAQGHRLQSRAFTAQGAPLSLTMSTVLPQS